MRQTLTLLLVGLLLAGCQNQPRDEKALPAASPTALANPAHPSGGSGSAAAGAASGTTLKGTVAERLDAASYSYLRITTATGEVWAAVPQTALAVGAPVVVKDASLMKDFASKTLGRTFPEIFFGTLGDEPAAAGGAPGEGHPGGASTAAAAAGAPSTPVEKAKGKDARSVAEVYAQKASLAGKPVLVRGRVVKVNSGIMGRTWAHLRDGTGTEGEANHDLTVTSQASFTVGDVVQVKGVVGVDKDFGGGYRYPVIVEDAERVP